MAQKLPWDALLDGQIYALDPDEDFKNLSLARMRILLRQKARDKGLKVRTAVTRPEHVKSGTVDKVGLLVIQAYAPSAEELAEWARNDAENAKVARQPDPIDLEYERAMREYREQERLLTREPQRIHEEQIREWDFE